VEPFVDAAWLHAQRDEVLAAHVVWDSERGRGAYDAGHVPGAVLVELDSDLAAAPTTAGGRHPLPSPETFTATLARLGIGDDTRVVAYDEQGGGIAARLVWMLRATGRDAALLDGGLAAWGGPLSPEPVRPTPTQPQVVAWPHELLVDADGAVAAALLLDARDAERYRGRYAGPDARAGHVPGAVNRPWADALDDDGRLLDDEVLRARYAPLVEAAGAAPVASCGSGVTACHALLVVEHLGLGRGRLFPGSWSAWAADPSRPVATGEQP